MRKIVLFLICLSVVMLYHARLLHGQPAPGKKSNPGYRFEYTFQGEATGTILLFFRYRFFFFASASVNLTAQKIDKNVTLFNFTGIDKTGLLFRTWGFSGKMLITAAADYDPDKTRQLLAKDFDLFKEKAPAYSRFIKTRRVVPFKIHTQGKNILAFKRGARGNHWSCSLDMKVKPLEKNERINFYFKIYPMLLEMVKIYNHSYLPDNFQGFARLTPDKEWLSQPLDFSKNINHIGVLATDIIEKYVTFKQDHPFRLTYRVKTRTPEMLVIHGKAVPRVKIWGGYKIIQVTRTIKIRLTDGLVLGDTFFVDIRNRRGRGGTAHSSLTLAQ